MHKLIIVLNLQINILYTFNYFIIISKTVRTKRYRGLCLLSFLTKFKIF